MTDAQDFAAYLERAMENARVSAADLARAAGVAPSVVSRWRKGSIPSVENLRLLSPVLGVPVRDLVVAARHMLPEEVGLVEVPTPPPRLFATIEDDILEDPELTDRAKQAMIAMYRALVAEDRETQKR